MVDKNEFFREVTLRICGSLDLGNAIRKTYDYIAQHIPLDILSLTIRDTKLAALRIIAREATGKVEVTDEIIPLSHHVWAKVQTWDLRLPAILNGELYFFAHAPI